MSKNMLFSSRSWLLIALLLVGVLSGLLAFLMANMFMVRDNTVKVEKITEKQVYLEDSSVISSIKTVKASVVTIVIWQDIENKLLNPASMSDLCVENPSICKEIAVVVTSDGGLIYGGNYQGLAVDDLRAVDGQGEVYELDKITESGGFTFYALVKQGEKVLSADKRTKFFGLRPVMINDLKTVELGQKTLVMKEFFGDWQMFGEGFVAAKVRTDGFLTDTSDQKPGVIMEFAGDAVEYPSMIFDFAGQLMVVRNFEGKDLSGEEILSLLNRMVVNKVDPSVVRFGLKCLNINKELSDALSLKVDYGCLVAEGVDADYQLQPGGIEKQSVAAGIGLKAGDIILEVNNESLLNVRLKPLLLNKAKGENVQFTVLRNGNTMTLKGGVK